jgi:hypothetical protein
MTRLGITRSSLSRSHVTRYLTGARMTRAVRAGVCLAAGAAVLVSASACGVTNTLVGIHEAPPARTDVAPLTVDQAKKIVSRSMTAAYLGETGTGEAAGTQLRTAYSEEGLRAANGRTRLATILPVTQTSSLRAPHPRLLAVSRGPGFPRFIVAQTEAATGGLPILHLLTSPNAAAPYRISMSVEMVPSASVKAFDPLRQGSSLVSNGPESTADERTGLAVSPNTLLNSYAAHMEFPPRPLTNVPFEQDSLSSQLRDKSSAVAKAVAVQATFTQTHKVVPSSMFAVRQDSGDALVFGVMERTDSFAVKPGQKVSTAGNAAFVRLTGKKVVTKSASITTLEFVVFALPRSSGKATLVAAREQVVAGSGS